MPVRRHPFFQARAGAVFAIRITSDKWGFVRFFRGLSMAILSQVASSPEMSGVDWNNPPVGWVFFSFAPNDDMTEAVFLGTIPFLDDASEWGPPCYVPPDIIDNCYKIHDKSMIYRATEKEIQGMSQCRTMTPAKLAEFLRERLKMGELKII